MGKTMETSTRSPFVAPFRADRATATPDIIVRVAAYDLIHFTAAVAHQMSVYVSSAVYAVTRFGRISRSKRATSLGASAVTTVACMGGRGLFCGSGGLK